MGRKPSAAELVHACIALAGLFRQSMAAALAPVGLTPEQHELLEAVESGVRNPTAIADALGRDKTTLSRSIARAVKAGFLVREKSKADQRRQHVELTEQGRSKLVQSKILIQKMSPLLLSALTPKDLRRLQKIIKKLLHLPKG